MKFLASVVLALALTLAAAKEDDKMSSSENDVLKASFGKDEGSAENCAKDRVPDFSLTWSPKVLQLGGDVTVAFHMTAVEDLDGGKANLTLWLPNIPQPLNEMMDFTCEDIHQLLPSLCPFKKGEKITFPPTKYQLTPEFPLAEGTIIMKAEVYNKDMALFLCMRVTLTTKA